MTPIAAILTLALVTKYNFSVEDQSDVGLNTVEMIENHGYPCESHDITTEDGYILTFHRIPYGKNDNSTNRPPVLLMHGLMSSSADFVDMGPNRSLSYILADMGYDVWLGNARGNAWSRNHTSLDIVDDAEKFFDFSWNEIGYYDLAAAIDHILETNGAESLYYVGHSQGCTSLLVLTSTRPEYNDKIKVASLMAPASFMDHQQNVVLTVLSKYIYELEEVALKYKIYELPFPELLQQIAFAICTNPDNSDLCLHALGLIDGVDADQMEFETYALALSNLPSNAAIKQLLHYGQNIKNGGFTQYDHGTEKNQEIYGSDTPPAYDLSKITAPIALYYGANDGLAREEDVKHLIESLTNVANAYKVPLDAFNHVDFVIAKDVVNLLYVELIKTMQQY